MIIPFPIPWRYFDDKSLKIGKNETVRWANHKKRNSAGYGEGIDARKKEEIWEKMKTWRLISDFEIEKDNQDIVDLANTIQDQWLTNRDGWKFNIWGFLK